MKKTKVLNDKLSLLIAQMGHTEKLCIADCGLPIPASSNRIDLALTPGIPSFLDTLSVILTELNIEAAIIASEMETVSPKLYKKVQTILKDIPIQKVSHETLKTQLPECKGIVRTGECISFANIILVSTVDFS